MNAPGGHGNDRLEAAGYDAAFLKLAAAYD
jgi:hypothetical protein